MNRTKFLRTLILGCAAVATAAAAILPGTAFAGPDDMTCGNWTRSGAKGAAMVGHHHRMGLRDNAPSRSWNASHASRGGCSQTALQGTGGAGLFYCFAAEQGGTP